MKPIIFNNGLYLKDPGGMPIYIERKEHVLKDLPPVHQHEFYELVYIVHGRAQHFFEGAYYDVYAGDVLFIKPGENHTYLLKPGATFEIVNCLFLHSLFEEEGMLHLDKKRNIPAFLEQPFFNKTEGFHHRLTLNREDSALLLVLLDKMVMEQQRRRSNSTTIIRLQLLELLFVLIRAYEEWLFRDQDTHVQHNERILVINKIQQYLEENYDQRLDMDMICSIHQISSRHMNRIFKQDTGRTVMEMTHHIRMEKAKQLLANTNERIIDISGKVGYEDPSFFIKLFARNIGCSPVKYRKQYR